MARSWSFRASSGMRRRARVGAGAVGIRACLFRPRPGRGRPRPMPYRIDTLAEFARHGFDTVIDVRSPAEFAEDHLPGAISLPALSDAERAVVGTIYKRESPFRARKVGAAMVARNVAAHLDGPLAGWRAGGARSSTAGGAGSGRGRSRSSCARWAGGSRRSRAGTGAFGGGWCGRCTRRRSRRGWCFWTGTRGRRRRRCWRG
jgi:rhodanese-related sulfurtransferase